MLICYNKLLQELNWIELKKKRCPFNCVTRKSLKFTNLRSKQITYWLLAKKLSFRKIILNVFIFSLIQNTQRKLTAFIYLKSIQYEYTRYYNVNSVFWLCACCAYKNEYSREENKKNWWNEYLGCVVEAQTEHLKCREKESERSK